MAQAAGSRLKRALSMRGLLGDDPRALLLLCLPTALAFFLDVMVRGRVLLGYALQGKAIYASSILVSMGFWVLPLWFAARLYLRPGRAARAFLVVFFACWVLPFATLGYGGQVLYHRVVHAYMGRDTVRLGFALRGTVRDWFVAWGSGLGLFAAFIGGILITVAILVAIRRAAPRVASGPIPIVPTVAFVGALFVMWIDMVDSRFLQAALPDDCFAHGAVHAVRVGITGKGRTRRGVSLRTPSPLPPLSISSNNADADSGAAGGSQTRRRPNVLLLLTESVRADAICSAASPKCKQSKFLDEAAPDRISLGRLTSPSPGTFGACVLLFTGLPANADVNAAHSAPVLWELAHAVGYRTSYITSQNLQFENFGAFFQRAGIDELVTATDLGGLKQEQLGAPDERATERMLHVIRETPQGTPYFGVLHLSNTHAPYRVDPALSPYEPHSDNQLGDVDELHNHYRNSVAMQERTVATFLKTLRALPGWDDTVVLFLSDHGEQFREHGGLYHLHSLFDEEVRVPGFLVAGGAAVSDEMRAELRTFGNYRTYFTDVNVTLLDLFGLEADVRASLPHANPFARSLMRRRRSEPLTILSTATAVWHEDDPRHGVMLGDRLLVGAPGGGPWSCFDVAHDPDEVEPLPPERCGRLMQDTAATLTTF